MSVFRESIITIFMLLFVAFVFFAYGAMCYYLFIMFMNLGVHWTASAAFSLLSVIKFNSITKIISKK